MLLQSSFPALCLEKLMSFHRLSLDAMVTAWLGSSLFCLGDSLRHFKIVPEKITMEDACPWQAQTGHWAHLVPGPGVGSTRELR